jgi:hypothetical protein
MQKGEFVQLVDPVARPVIVAGSLAPRLPSLDGTTIGLWANMKLNAVELMDQVEAVLRERHDIAGVVRGKYHPARVMGTNEWPGIDACDAALLTHGD